MITPNQTNTNSSIQEEQIIDEETFHRRNAYSREKRALKKSSFQGKDLLVLI